ncbi:hypothetical protein BJ546DRAFT_683571 [Cryomyces antarcticus]
MESSGVRKSGRKRQPNKRYTIDAFEGLDLLQDEGPEDELPSDVDNEDKDAEFELENAPTPLLEGDDLSLDESSAGEASEDDAEGDEVEQHDSEPNVDSDTGSQASAAARRKASKAANRTATGVASAGDQINVRGILDLKNYMNRRRRVLYTFGPATEDSKPGVQARDKWIEEPSLPSHNVDERGVGGFARSFAHTEKMRKREATEGWMWYYEHGGREAFLQGQRTVKMAEEQASAYIPRREQNSRSFLMGPHKSPKLFELDVGQSLELDDAWTGLNQPSGEPPDVPCKSRRNGFMLNIGANVHCMDWVPNWNGSLQYLALSVLDLSRHDDDERLFESSEAPAYTPQNPSPASIQIWMFHATSASGRQGTIDTSRSPKLQLVICTDWGDVKQFKWCPMPTREVDNSENARVHLGLLASLWGDGAVRVLDIHCDKSPVAPTQYLHVTTAAFASIPPDTICTCLTWLSTMDIAAGCANGCLAIWSLSSHLSQSPTRTSAPASARNPNDIAFPWLYTPLSNTYVLTLTSCYPSRPYLLLSASMSGHLCLTDLRCGAAGITSNTSTILSSRARISHTLVVWHDSSQCALSVDENFTLRAYPVRRFFANIALARFGAGVVERALAVSPVHPFVLAGTAGGEVAATNPLRRVWAGKGTMWVQTWFRHEWRRGPTGKMDGASVAAAVNPTSIHAPTATTSPPLQSSHQSVPDPPPPTQPQPGLSRLTESFKLARQTLDSTRRGLPNSHAGVLYSTLYEEATGISCVVWNPNLGDLSHGMGVGGWAAAAMARGLVRVEDVAGRGRSRE